MRYTAIVISSSLLLILAAACGDDGAEKDWEEEIILQLFKRKASTLGALVIEASVGGGTPAKLTVNKDGKFFADCESNKVRILPKKQGATYADVKVKVLSASSAPITYDQRTLSVPVAGVVKIVVLKGKEMMPAGKCTPIVKLKALGEACDRDDDCENSKCLTSVKDTSTTHSFTNGYCSEDCTKSKTCLSGGLCQAYNEFATNPVRYCLKKCSGNIDCRATEGYSCPGGACIP